MYKVEFIYKSSVLNDILDNWNAMGKTQENNESGGFIFECDLQPAVLDGLIIINRDGSEFIYNISDFYRVKITKQGN